MPSKRPIFLAFTREAISSVRSRWQGRESSPGLNRSESNWHDLRLVPASLVSWLAALLGVRLEIWVAAITLLGSFLLAAGIVLVGSQLISAQRRRRAQRLRKVCHQLLLTLGIGAAALLFSALLSWQRVPGPLIDPIDQGSSIIATLEVSDSPQPLAKSDRVSIKLKLKHVKINGLEFDSHADLTAIAAGAWAQLRPGQTVVAAGNLRKVDPGEPVIARFTPKTLPRILPDEQAVTSWLTRLRFQFNSSAAAPWKDFWPDAGALLPGMVLGDRSGLTPELAQSMRTSGLTHLTAVSGTNCTISSCQSYFARQKLSRTAMACCHSLGAGAPDVRSIGRPRSKCLARGADGGGLGAVALLSGRPKSIGPLLSLTVIALLLLDPWLAGSFSFLLSVLATVGLISLGVPSQRWLAAILPGSLASAISVPLSAQLFCSPAIVLLQPQLASYTLPANILAAPVVAAGTIFGMLALCSVIFVPWLASVLLIVAGLTAGWVSTVARFFSELPGAALPWPPGWGGVVAMAAFSLSVVFLLFLGSIREKLPDPDGQNIAHLRTLNWFLRLRHQFVWPICVGSGGFLGFVIGRLMLRTAFGMPA